MRKRALPIVTFRLDGPDDITHSVSGRDAETLRLLTKRGKAGVTALAFPGGPAYRLSAYIKNLRDRGLEIETLRERHDCGSHGRYVLHSSVTVLSVREARHDAAA